MNTRPTVPEPITRPVRRPALVSRLLAGVTIAFFVVAGVLLAGRVALTEKMAMRLTGLWLAIALSACALVARRRRHLAVPLILGYALSAVAIVGVLSVPQLGDREVSERVPTGVPSQEASSDANVQLAIGEITGLAHPAAGTAAVVHVDNRDRTLTLTDFATENGPDLRVYLTTQDPATGELGEFEDLGALKGNRGDQQYDIGAHVDLAQYRYVVVWSRTFTVAFASAELTAGAA
jgi:hypothetical protein